MITNLDIAKLKGWKLVGGIMEWYNDENIIVIPDAKLPDWTGNIADAWGLVEEMVAGGAHRYEMVIYENSSIWRAGIYGNDGFLIIAEIGDTAPQAICEAYAKWKGA